MADVSLRNLSQIRQKYPEVFEALMDAQSSINNMGRQGNLAPVCSIPPPPAHAGLSVTGGGGKLDIKISDPHPAYMGAERFADVSSDPSFSTFHTIHIGASQNWRGDSPVPGVAHVRTYSQYPTSPDTSAHLYHATPVDTSGASAAPTQSGDAISGYGSSYNTALPPKR